MDYTTAQPSNENLDSESFLTKEELIKQLEISGVHLGDDPGERIDTFVNAGILPIPQVGHFPTWTLQRIIAIENKLAEGQSLEDIRKEVSAERRRFLSGVKDLNSLVTLYKKFQKNSAFFLFSFLLLFLLSMGVVASNIVAPGNPVAVAGEYAVKAVTEGAGKVAKVAAAPVGKTIVTIIKTSTPEDTKSVDPLGLTNLENVALVDDLGNLLITGNLTAKVFSGSGEKLTNLPAGEVVGELELATLPWGSLTDRPKILSAIDSISSDEGNIDLVAGSNVTIIGDPLAKTITIAAASVVPKETSLVAGFGISIAGTFPDFTITNTDLGSSQAIFKNLAVATQSTLVADANDDTLTLIAGANLVITTDAPGDSITFSVTGTVANADTLDLLDSSQFLRSDTSDSFTSGTLTIALGTTLDVLGTFTCTNCVGDAAVVNGLTIDATGSVAAAAVTGSFTDAQISNTLTIDATGAINAGAISSGTLGAAGVTLALGSFGSITGALADTNVADTITASNYLPLAGGTMAGNINLNNNLLLNIGNAGTDFDASGGLALAGTETLSALSISSGSRVANTITFNPAAGGSQYGYNLAITNAPTVSANTAYGIYVSQTDTVDLANTNYGVYSTVTHTGPTSGTINTYGGYFTAIGSTGGNSTTYGVYGSASGADISYGLYGSGTNFGVFGSANDYGVYGSATTYGVYGSGVNYGLYGTGGTYSVYGTGGLYGFYGDGTNTGAYGVGGTYGVYGSGIYGVYGLGNGVGVNYGLYGDVGGARTAAVYSGYFTNTATSSTNSINKYGLYITSTGAWTGTGAANYALYIADPTGGTANYAIFQNGATGTNILNANTRIGGTTTPTVALDVTGQIQTTSTLTFSGAIATDITTTANNNLDIAPNGSGATHFSSGAILASGTTGLTPASGAGTRLMWIPAKAAFRAGIVSAAQWDDANIGSYSTAMGRDTTAGGDFSAAMGGFNTASGLYSTAMGDTTIASAWASTTMGSGNTASGMYSLAAGRYLTAGPATNTIVLGRGVSDTDRLVNNTASSLMVGFNTTIATLFVSPGSGVGTFGKVGINNSSPTVALDVTGQIQTTSTLTFSGAIATDITTTANNSLDIAPNGTGGINFTSGATTGTAFTFNANSVTSGDGLGVTVNSLTGGFGFYVTAVGSSPNVLAGAIAAIQTGRTYTGLSATGTGSVLEVDRLPLINSAGQVLTLSGPLLEISEFADVEISGTITHTNPLVKIDAQNTSSQPIMIISTSGTQDLLAFDAVVAGTISNGIVFSALGPTVITDAIDVSDTEIVNAINVGDNTVLGTTANLDFTYFDVAGTDGAITAGVSTATHTLTGMLCVRNATACPAQAAGRLYVDTTGTAAGDDPGDVFDIAEYFPATEAVEPGDVLIADSNQAKAVKRSSESYQGSLIGIVSTTPAATIDEGFFSIGANKFDPTHPYVALAGRVPTKVSTENGPIFIGDPLTSSSSPGVAMRADKSGPIVGKALEPFDGAQGDIGRIMVFVSVGWFVQPVTSDQSPVTSNLTSIDVQTLTAGTINAQVLFVGDRKISMTKDGSLKIEGNVEITGSLIAGKISTDELVVSEKSSGSANIKAGAEQVTVDNVLVKETSKVLVTFTTDYSPATRYYVTKELGKSFTLHLDQPVQTEATFNWFVIN